MNSLNKEDIEFLKNLQQKMLTQDTCGQSNPRYWAVGNKTRIYGIDKDFDFDGTEVIYNCELIAENLKELYNYLKRVEKDIDIEYFEDSLEEYVSIIDNVEEHYFYTVEDLVDYMTENLNYDSSLYCVNYKEEYVIAENTIFLTLEECEKHIKGNSHHYNEPISYAMTAWRSPEVARLYQILENTNWDQYLK